MAGRSPSGSSASPFRLLGPAVSAPAGAPRALWPALRRGLSGASARGIQPVIVAMWMRFATAKRAAACARNARSWAALAGAATLTRISSPESDSSPDAAAVSCVASSSGVSCLRGRGGGGIGTHGRERWRAGDARSATWWDGARLGGEPRRAACMALRVVLAARAHCARRHAVAIHISIPAHTVQCDCL